MLLWPPPAQVLLFRIDGPTDKNHFKAWTPTVGFVTEINMLSKRVKENTIKSVRRHDTDTGSPEAQVALLTRRINELSSHLRKHKKDFHSRRGLLQMVANRRKHLRYLQKKDTDAYEALIKKLNLKK